MVVLAGIAAAAVHIDFASAASADLGEAHDLGVDKVG